MQSDQIESSIPENFKALQGELAKLSKAEEKLGHVVTFLESTLAQAGSPHFKDFWEAKKLALELFKEHIHPSVRLQLWARYSELAKEARRLKEIFDEETAYAVEQIEMAVSACEHDVKEIQAFLENEPHFRFSHEVKEVLHHLRDYSPLQRELNLLNTFATKVTQLRKELQRTEMRVRDKNRFFDRLSLLGDAVFPRRKELIAQVSALFLEDVDLYIEKHFSHEMRVASLLDTRNQIKALQSAAKELTLNTESFQATRKRLSECWDTIAKMLDGERKKEMDAREEYRRHREEIVEALELLKGKFAEKAISEKEALNQLDGIQNKIRGLSLTRHEAEALKSKVFETREIFTARERAELQHAKEVLQQAQANKEKEQEALYKSVEDLFRGAEAYEAVKLQEEIEALSKQVEKANFARAKKLALDALFAKLKDALFQLQEKDMDVAALLKERKKRDKEIKARIEQLRKKQGGSSFDFTEALHYEELLEEEKVKLQENREAIEQLEERL